MIKPIAIVTGAASGMGREFVRLLDNLGFYEIWAIDTNIPHLKSLQIECTTKIIPLAFDLTKEESYIAFRNLLYQEKPRVDWLVCSAGFGKFGRHDEICIQETKAMIDLNCRSYVMLTESAIPFMEKGSRIVHIASVAGFQPVPYMTTYAATKAFSISYARALNQELKPKGISVTCVCPCWTKTAFFRRAEKTSPEEKIVKHYSVMYDARLVISKAFNDAKKRKEMSIYGAKARAQVRFVKGCSHKWVMRKWIKQQKLNKKYEKK